MLRRFPGTHSDIPKTFLRKSGQNKYAEKNQHVNAGVCAPGVEEEVKIKILISE